MTLLISSRVCQDPSKENARQTRRESSIILAGGYLKDEQEEAKQDTSCKLRSHSFFITNSVQFQNNIESVSQRGLSREISRRRFSSNEYGKSLQERKTYSLNKLESHKKDIRRDNNNSKQDQSLKHSRDTLSPQSARERSISFHDQSLPEMRKRHSQVSRLNSQRRKSYNEPNQCDLKKKLAEVSQVTKRRESFHQRRSSSMKMDINSNKLKRELSRRNSTRKEVSEKLPKSKSKDVEDMLKIDDGMFKIVHGWIEPVSDTKEVEVKYKEKAKNFLAAKLKTKKSADNGVFSFWSPMA